MLAIFIRRCSAKNGPNAANCFAVNIISTRAGSRRISASSLLMARSAGNQLIGWLGSPANAGFMVVAG
jgi:hypothetical protein